MQLDIAICIWSSHTGHRVCRRNSLTVTIQSKLVKWDLCGCRVTNQPGYSDQVFSLLPNLQLLDGLDKEGKEGQESSDEEDYEGKEIVWH